MIVAEGFVKVGTVSYSEMLQWGRNLIVAEGGQRAGRASHARSLQWGRNLIVAEGLPTGFVGGRV